MVEDENIQKTTGYLVELQSFLQVGCASTPMLLPPVNADDETPW